MEESASFYKPTELDLSEYKERPVVKGKKQQSNLGSEKLSGKTTATGMTGATGLTGWMTMLCKGAKAGGVIKNNNNIIAV